ncbi:hypothetical protein C9374_001483 [Naegleria lovaniensis]|uniref:ATP-dependent RNA helicase n=1 Tax=Naegleria lovaniensis TaxID=51637 RepID=A0AA88GRM6_NAELO|nr:uncharacterized protein C9374_001483 [Naegleria lovaniensis]KAG2387151.1 hypothetical protein C9374_001483 [Naegleria lovaniensis]
MKSFTKLCSRSLHNASALWKTHSSVRFYQIDLGKVASTFAIPSLTSFQNKALEVVSSSENDKDILIQAPLYSGKTLSYLIPTFEVVTKAIREERWTERPGFRALIIVPSREAALAVGRQVDQYINSLPESERPNASVEKPSFDTYNRNASRKQGHELIEEYDDYKAYEHSQTRRENVYGLSYAITCGGKSFEKEISMLDASEPEIIIATPGRLVDHLKNSDYFRNVKLVIVDDCSMFKGPMASMMDQIFTPENISPNAKRIFINDTEGTFSKFLRNSENVEVLTSEETITKQNVKQSVIKTQNTAEQLKVLYQILSENKHKKVAVFSDSAKVIHAHYLMAENNLFSSLISSRISPTRAMTSFSYFNEQENGIAFCSNIASPMNPNVDLVIHLDAPATQQVYEARISRAFGKSNSQSIVLVSSSSENVPEYLSNVSSSPVPSGSANEFVIKPLRVAQVQQENGYHLLLNCVTKYAESGLEKKAAVEKAISTLKDMGFSEGLPKISKRTAIKIGFEKELLEADLLLP